MGAANTHCFSPHAANLLVRLLPKLLPILGGAITVAGEDNESPELDHNQPWALPTAAKASKSEAEAVVGRPLPVELFEFDQIWGRRVLVVCESPEVLYGSIVIPIAALAREPRTTGWVVACGPWVGTPEQGLPGWSPFPPEELLLKRVLFSAFAGTDLPVTQDPGKMSNKEFAEWVEAGEQHSERTGRRLSAPYLLLGSDGDIFWSY